VIEDIFGFFDLSGHVSVIIISYISAAQNPRCYRSVYLLLVVLVFIYIIHLAKNNSCILYILFSRTLLVHTRK